MTPDAALGSPTGTPVASSAARGRRADAIRFRLRTSGVEPVARLLAWILYAAWASAVTWMRGLGESGAARAKRRTALADALTQRLVGVLGALKGAFAKAGQFAAMRPDLVHARHSEALTALQDRVAPISFERVRGVIETEFGATIAERFARFDAVPIGAASIAQVHRARLDDGTEVAVKVQYPWIAASLAADLRLLHALGRAGLWLRGKRAAVPDFGRLFDEFASGLADELDFRAEAHAAASIAANLADDPQVVVPAIVSSHTRRRVLTMHYHASVSIGDAEGLERLHAPRRAVLEVLARAYAKQVFVDGLFHADPHPGNLFVLDEPRAATDPRVLFVDFGLCKQLAPELRREMRLGIYALLKRDVDAFVDHMAGLGMIATGARPGVEAAVALMFDQIAGGAQQGNVLAASGAQVLALKDEAKRLLQETPGLQLPNDLLLYAKTLSYLFALGERLDPDVDLMKLTLPYLLRFLATSE